jgi:hypothetical protein
MVRTARLPMPGARGMGGTIESETVRVKPVNATETGVGLGATESRRHTYSREVSGWLFGRLLFRSFFV